MSSIVKYKEYWAKVEFDSEDCVLHGKIEGISDLVTFECDSACEVQREFENAVDDYIDYCQRLGKQPQKPCSGTFNVRISPELHRKCMIRASQQGVSLNKFIGNALEQAMISDGRSKIELHMHMDRIINNISRIPQNFATYNTADQLNGRLKYTQNGKNILKFAVRRN